MLTFVGLGLWDERSVTIEGRAALQVADRIFAEFYTSRLMGTTVADLEAYHDIDIEVRERDGVEGDPGPILEAAKAGDAVFLTAGDAMISTTHVDLRLRAHEQDIETHIIHGTTAEAAAASLTGLQNYRFGKATTLPFPYATGTEGVPGSVLDTVDANQDQGLHTLVYLDIKAERGEFMTADVAADQLAVEYPDALGVVVARAGSPDPLVVADRIRALADRSFGDPLHLLVVPGDLHHVEREALEELAGAPADALP